MNAKQTLLKKIADRTLQLGVIGLGYVGLPLACEFAKNGVKVTGFDLDPRKISALEKGHNYIQDIPDELVARLVRDGFLRATSLMERLREMDAISICVPTPLNKTKDPDLSYIISATETLKKNLRRGQVIVLESTTYPGTTDEILLPRLSESGLVAGTDFFLSFSPERVDPGNPKFKTANTPKVIGGVTPDCLEVSRKLYEIAIQTMVPVSSPAAAEMVKLLENTFRAVNIGLANEIAIMSRKLGINCWEVIEAAATKPFGFMPFYPGPGLGGHCIPIDPIYLSWKLKSINYDARFIQLADTINSSMPQFVVELINEALNSRKKCLNGSQILLAGMAYKENVDDYRESPSVHILELLESKGAVVFYVDPWVPEIQLAHGHAKKGVELKATKWEEYDCVALLTRHRAFDIPSMAERSLLFIDARNATKGIKRDNIFRI